MGIETRSSSRIIRGAFPSALLSFINRVSCEFLHVKPTLHSLHFPSLIILCYICCGVGFCLLIVCPLVPRLLNAYINILFNEFSLKVEIYCLEFLQIFIDHIYYFLSQVSSYTILTFIFVSEKDLEISPAFSIFY